MSSVWKHFNETDGGETATCNFCQICFVIHLLRDFPLLNENGSFPYFAQIIVTDRHHVTNVTALVAYHRGRSMQRTTVERTMTALPLRFSLPLMHTPHLQYNSIRRLSGADVTRCAWLELARASSLAHSARASSSQEIVQKPSRTGGLVHEWFALYF